MTDFSVSEMLDMQKTLHEKYKDIWPALSPATGKDSLLWMLGEAGEVIDIVKKHGGENASRDSQLRAHLVEELADVLMYYGNVLLCYGITPEELKETYEEKFRKNMRRW